MRKDLFPYVLLLWLAFQFPFLNADPDILVDLNTRGAWTDEGLYASQLRNLVDAGAFNLHENSTFVRGPVYSLVQLPFFFVFGTHLLVARLIVLLSLVLALVWFYWRYPQFQLFTTFLLLTTLSQFQLFHFSHYALAEMFCMGLTLTSLLYFLQWYERIHLGRRAALSLVRSSFFLFLAYASKIQFLYLAFLPSLVIFFLMGSEFFGNRSAIRKMAMQFGLSLLIMVFFMLIYGLWYWINHDFYNYIMQSETSGRYATNVKDLFITARFNIEAYLWTKEARLLVLLAMLSLLAYPFIKRFGKPDKRLEIILLFGLSWLILELHKLPMVYLPNRYLLSMFFAMGVILSAILAMLAGEGKYIRMLAYCFVVSLGLIYLSGIYESYIRRSNDLAKANAYFSNKNLAGTYVLGSWAPSLSWESKARTIPVWYNYFNWREPIKTFHPKCIITEYNEAESDYAYEQQGIKLDSISDSSRMFQIWRYNVVVYWIKQTP
ncbi:MAG: hypothetical protein WCO63_10575 [Bacteroidota bacterium]